MVVKLSKAAAGLLCIPLFCGWFSSPEDKLNVSIASVNGKAVDHTQSGFSELPNLSLPLTVAVVITPTGDEVYTEIKLQVYAGSSWVNVATRTNQDSDDLNFSEKENAFGYGVVTAAHVGAETNIKLRLYISDSIYENADEAQDTTADGTSGWADSWVAGVTLTPGAVRPDRVKYIP